MPTTTSSPPSSSSSSWSSSSSRDRSSTRARRRRPGPRARQGRSRRPRRDSRATGGAECRGADRWSARPSRANAHTRASTAVARVRERASGRRGGRAKRSKSRERSRERRESDRSRAALTSKMRFENRSDASVSGAIDVTKTFRGEGEDAIAALIAASGRNRRERRRRGGRGMRRGGPVAAVDVDGEVVKEKRSFERELVPFDFGDGGGASIAEASGGAVKAAKRCAPAAAKSGKMPKPKAGRRRRIRRFRAEERFRSSRTRESSLRAATVDADARRKGGDVCRRPERWRKKKNKRITGADRAKAATNDQQWANSSFQTRLRRDQLPMPSFLKDVAAPSAPRDRSMPPRAPPTPTSAQDLKNLLGVKTNPPPHACRRHRCHRRRKPRDTRCLTTS